MYFARDPEELAKNRRSSEEILESKLDDWSVEIDNTLEDFEQKAIPRKNLSDKLARSLINFGKHVLLIIEIEASGCFQNVE